MTFLAEVCTDGWTPGNVFWLIVGLFVVLGMFGMFDERGTNR